MTEIFVYALTIALIICGLTLVTLRNRLLSLTGKRDLLYPWGSFLGIMFKFKLDKTNSNSKAIKLAQTYNKLVMVLYSLIIIAVLFLIIGNMVQAYS